MFAILFVAIIQFIKNPNTFHRLNQNKLVLLPLLLWLTLFTIGLMQGNISEGMNELKTLIPFAFAPFLFLAFPRLHLRMIWYGFILGVFISILGSSLYAALHYPLPDPRTASIFISHIRLSLFAALALYLLFQLELPFKKGLIFIFSICLLAFLVLTATISGWIFLLITALVHLSFKHKISIVVVAILIPSLFTTFAVWKYTQLNATESTGNTLATTINGIPYDYAGPSHQTENGYFIFQNIQENELKQAWFNRTQTSTDSKDQRNQTLYSTLVRYLTSKNLTKDSLGVYSLNEDDLHNIQLGYTNVNEPTRSPLERRYYQVIYELQVFIDHGNASGHSLFQRLHYYRAANHIIRSSFPLGVGIGNVKSQYNQAYLATKSNIDANHQHAVHNQFLSYLISGGIAALLLFIGYFVFAWREGSKMGLFEASITKVFLVLAFVSCLSEDTLTTQPGVAFFAVFTAVLFTRRNN